MLHPVSFCSPIALDPVSKVFGIDVIENEGDDGAIVELCKGCDGGRRPREVERVYLACQFCWGEPVQGREWDWEYTQSISASAIAGSSVVVIVARNVCGSCGIS